jgi:hypothetical protein
MSPKVYLGKRKRNPPSSEPKAYFAWIRLGVLSKESRGIKLVRIGIGFGVVKD